eukprot:TRINITY_DN14355_c0_g2_i2.p1 TRINITY_DN14355_c0_g2~~TRINITY_DN14355_c0_g2_i2.p1  ORF type:complete len:223 (+),score=58.32 TRINITY_DN14355_c0_g2_i2:134-802(+)
MKLNDHFESAIPSSTYCSPGLKESFSANRKLSRSKSNSQLSKSTTHKFNKSSLPMSRILYVPCENDKKENICLMNIGTTIYSPNTLKPVPHISRYQTSHPQPTPKRRAGKNTNFQLPKENGVIAERAKVMQYYRKKSRISKKYREMLSSLAKEEAEEISWTMTRYDREYVVERVKEINQDYALTKNLIQQQQLIEEEELLKSYRSIVTVSYTHLTLPTNREV